MPTSTGAAGRRALRRRRSKLMRDRWTARLDVENEGDNPRDQDRDDRQGDGRQPSQNADVVGPYGHRGHLPVHHVHSEQVADVMRGVGSCAVLEDRGQLRPESSDLLLLLMKHPLMESSQRQEEQHETEEDEPRQKSSDPEDIGKFGVDGDPVTASRKSPMKTKYPTARE